MGGNNVLQSRITARPDGRFLLLSEIYWHVTVIMSLRELCKCAGARSHSTVKELMRWGAYTQAKRRP